jgi:hypothetical protein
LLLEILGLYLLSALALCILSEISRNYMWGIIGGIILLLAGMQMVIDAHALETRIGSDYAIFDISTLDPSIYGNSTDVSGFSTATYVFTPINLPVPNMATILLVLSGVAMAYSYAVRNR